MRREIELQRRYRDPARRDGGYVGAILDHPRWRFAAAPILLVTAWILPFYENVSVDSLAKAGDLHPTNLLAGNGRHIHVQQEILASTGKDSLG